MHFDSKDFFKHAPWVAVAIGGMSMGLSIANFVVPKERFHELEVRVSAIERQNEATRARLKEIDKKLDRILNRLER